MCFSSGFSKPIGRAFATHVLLKQETKLKVLRESLVDSLVDSAGNLQQKLSHDPTIPEKSCYNTLYNISFQKWDRPTAQQWQTRLFFVYNDFVQLMNDDA